MRCVGFLIGLSSFPCVRSFRGGERLRSEVRRAEKGFNVADGRTGARAAMLQRFLTTS
jgi:hypothetical protein